MFRFFLFVCLCLSSLGYAQQDSLVDFLKIDAAIEPFTTEAKVFGSVKVKFKTLQAVDSIYLDAQHMTIKGQAMEGVPVKALENKIWLIGPFEAFRTYTAFFQYEAFPKQTLYFGHHQIWTQGQGKYTSNWLPSLDVMTDKMEFDLTLIIPSGSIAIANGTLVSKIPKGPKVYWKFNMQQPMSSYLVAFAVGNFEHRTLTSESGIPIELYYEPKDSAYFEPTYRYTQQLFDFLGEEIGVPYPWQNYKEVPIRDFLYAGMENTGCTFFSEAFVTDSVAFKDRNYINVNAHEMAHQWFGNLVTETEGKHHWLHEGFATYYALLAERALFGTDYYYWKLFQSAEQLKALSEEGKGEYLLDPKASSLTFYEKGAWALHILKETIGEDTFKNAVKNYLKKHAYQNVNTEDFLYEIRALTNTDISSWEQDWLYQSAFQSEAAYQSLMQSPFIQKYFETAALWDLPLSNKEAQLREAIQGGNEFIGQEAVYQLSKEPFSEVMSLYQTAMKTENIWVRQAVALSMDGIPESFRAEYENLLNDASYLTQEAALYNLWLQFPGKRTVYLDRMDGIMGFQDKNIRQLWLTLALYTEGYRTDTKKGYLEELLGYSGPDFSFEIRQKAFEYLYAMGISDPVFIQNLINACTHHYWRFRDAARAMLDNFMEEEGNKAQVLALFSSYSEKEKA
ncbi:MAG: M1 family metallopeptidase [Flavobacteriaceae bacterium]